MKSPCFARAFSCVQVTNQLSVTQKAHSMTHIKVPHTIKRAGFYYLNIRIKASILRVSLKTKDSHVACSIVLSIIDFLRIKGGSSNMDKSAIQNAVLSIRDKVLGKLRAVLMPDSEEAQMALKAYEKYHSPLALAHHNYDTFPYQTEITEPPPIKTLTEFKLGKLDQGKVSISNDADLMLSSVLELRKMSERLFGDSNWRAIKHSAEYFQATEDLNHFLSNARAIRTEVETHDLTKAKQIYKGITGNVTFDEVVESSKTLEPFEHYFNMFWEAGKSGNLPDKRAAWTPKIAKEWASKGAVFNNLFQGITLDKVSSRELDEAFDQVIFNLPESNKNPYVKMTIEQRIKCVEEGQIEEEDTISPSSVSNYKKLLQSLYSYLHSKHIITNNPVSLMRTKIPNGGNKRGAFENLTVRKIVDYCTGQKDLNKKWPVLIMAYSGMRNGEVLQLRKEDIKQCLETNIYYMHITPESGSVKTKAGIRRVPIHQELLSLRFLDFVNSQPKGKLFVKDSKFLTRYYTSTIKLNCSIPDKNEFEESLTLYSLRHTVITKLQENNVNKAITQQIVGHSKQSSVTDDYTHIFSLKILEKYLNKVAYR
jgi:integrase